MASIYRPTYKRPIPPGAEIATRKGKTVAVWKDDKGRTKRAPLSEDGKSIVLQYTCYYIAYEGADGRRITVKGFPDREATEALARDKVKLAARIKSGLVTVDMDKAGMATAEAVDAWTADLRRRGKSKVYVHNVETMTKRIATDCGWHTLGAIRSDALAAWLASPDRKRLAARTLNQYLETARTFLNWCCAQRPPWLPGNPLDGIEPADETIKVREKRAYTLDELDRLRKASGKRWAIYLTAALTGLRRSELRRLQWGDVHLDADPPHIQLRAVATKAKRPDVIPINPELLEVLRAIRPADAQGDQLVFPAVPTNDTFRRDVEVRAKIPWRDAHGRLASFHALRKTFGTYLALANVPLRVAMDMMRVTDAKLLNGVYTDAKLFNTAAAAEKLPRLVRPDEPAEGDAEAKCG